MNLVSKSYRMQVEAHLDVEIDGHPAQLNGRGDQLQLILEGEETLYSLFNSHAGAGQLANVLADSGLTLTVIDEQQPLLKIGHNASSRLIGLFTGSRHIVPASLPSLIKLLRGYLNGRRE
jgi:hypothetical protein